MAQAKFRAAPEVEAIANDLIPQYHQHLIDFSVKIRYVFIDKTPKTKGRETWGTCRKISGLNAFLEGDNKEGDPLFVITISEPVWDVLPQDKRIALVDHELCHAWAEAKQQKNDGDGDSDMETDNPVKLSIKPHDVEEFSCIIRRHGLWDDGLEEFIDAALKAKRGDKNETGDS